MTGDILKVVVDPNWQNTNLAYADALERGETIGHILSFASVGLFFKDLTENRWSLVRSLIGQEPMSIRGIARFVNREQRRVFDDIKILGELGLLEKDSNNKWFCPYDDIHISMHLAAA